ncbi:MAG: STAS domain-containing protein [Fibrobacterota bacterium]
MIIKEIYLGRCKRLEIQGDINKLDLVRLSGHLDASREAASIEIDLTGVLFAGSDFLNFLVDLRNHRPEIARKVALYNPNEVITELLSMTQLDQVFAIHRDEVLKVVL